MSRPRHRPKAGRRWAGSEDVGGCAGVRRVWGYSGAGGLTQGY